MADAPGESGPERDEMEDLDVSEQQAEEVRGGRMGRGGELPADPIPG